MSAQAALEQFDGRDGASYLEAQGNSYLSFTKDGIDVEVLVPAGSLEWFVTAIGDGGRRASFWVDGFSSDEVEESVVWVVNRLLARRLALSPERLGLATILLWEVDEEWYQADWGESDRPWSARDEYIALSVVSVIVPAIVVAVLWVAWTVGSWLLDL